MPPVVGPPFKGAVQAAAIEKAAMTLLTRNTVAPFNLTLLNLGERSLFACGATRKRQLLSQWIMGYCTDVFDGMIKACGSMWEYVGMGLQLYLEK